MRRYLQALIVSAALHGTAASAAEPSPVAPGPHQKAIEACLTYPDGQAAACVLSLDDAVPPGLQVAGSQVVDQQLRAAADAWSRTLDAVVLRHAQALAARGDGRSLVTAALLASASVRNPTGHPPQQALAWLLAASAPGTAEPLALWLQANGCMGFGGGCDRDAAAAQLLAVDADNAAAQLLAFDRAWQAGDIAAARTHLRLAGSAPEFRSYTAAALHALEQARQSMPEVAMPAELGPVFGRMYGLGGPITAEDLNVMPLMATWAAFPLPAFASLLQACDSDRPQLRSDAGLRQDCIAVLKRLAEDETTVIAPMVGLTLVSRLTAGQPAGDHWRERLRQLYWLHQSAAAFQPGLPGSHVTSGEYFGWLATGGELEAFRRVMLRNGADPEPPTGWLPDHRRHRALVTTGIVPE